MQIFRLCISFLFFVTWELLSWCWPWVARVAFLSPCSWSRAAPWLCLGALGPRPGPRPRPRLLTGLPTPHSHRYPWVWQAPYTLANRILYITAEWLSCVGLLSECWPGPGWSQDWKLCRIPRRPGAWAMTRLLPGSCIRCWKWVWKPGRPVAAAQGSLSVLVLSIIRGSQCFKFFLILLIW